MVASSAIHSLRDRLVMQGDLERKAARVAAIVEGNFGRVISREGDIMHVEIPADCQGRPPLGSIGVVACVTGQTTRFAPRRVPSMSGQWVVCPAT
jgi:hypothetical protein